MSPSPVDFVGQADTARANDSEPSPPAAPQSNQPCEMSATDVGNGALPGQPTDGEQSFSTDVPTVASAVENDCGSTAIADSHRFEESLLRRFDEFEQTIAEKLGELVSINNTLVADADERREMRQTRESLYEKLEASRSSFQFQLLRPLVQRIALLHDLLGDYRTFPPQDANAAVAVIEVLANHLTETMKLHGIESIAPEPGDAFDARFHHVAVTEDTANAADDSRVARCLLGGFVYFGQNDRTGDLRPAVVRPARIVMWRYNPALAEKSSTCKAAGDDAAGRQ
jgi:molecular chaperone GrpE (heat shock protein)